MTIIWLPGMIRDTLLTFNSVGNKPFVSSGIFCKSEHNEISTKDTTFSDIVLLSVTC